MEDLEKQLSQLKSRATNAIELVNFIRNKIDRVTKSLNRMREYKWSDDIEDAVFIGTLSKFGDKPIAILLNEAEKALSSSREFSYPPYSSGLIKAILNGGEGIIISRSKRDTKISIDMDRICGRLSEYASAVKLARKQLNIGKISKLNPDIASKIWSEKIYGVYTGGSVKRKRKGGEIEDITERYLGLYELTVAVRMNFFKSQAPWWSLLDKGNAGPAFKDNGGFPTPEQAPTNFVKKSEWRIASEFYSIYSSELDKLRKKVETRIEKYEKEIEFWKKEIDKVTGGVGGERYKIARDELYQRVKNWQFVDFERLENLISRLATGERINPKSGVRLGKGNRIRVLAIANRINQIFGEL